MPFHHTVRPGECLSSIAHSRGLFWETVWNHPDNSDLREQRGDPNCLTPGDRVFIPDRTLGHVVATTDRSHTFRLRTTPVPFRTRVIVDGEPLAAEPYTLIVDGTTCLEGVTDAQGWVDELVAAGAVRGVLAIDGREIRIGFRYLGPPETFEGARHRLTNLGYLRPYGPLTPGAFRDSLERFQRDHDLPVTGELDDGTRDALRSEHRGGR